MQYIVLDIEMNSRNFKSIKPIEVIEIGAVKLNSEYVKIDTFSSVIKPIYFPRLNKFIKKLTGIQQEEIDESEGFPFIFDWFRQWCGHDFIFVTWGKEDIKYLKQDAQYHDINYNWIGDSYIDLAEHIKSKYSLNGDIGLRKSVEVIGLAWEGEQHRALPDALNTARIFEIINKVNFDKTIFDIIVRKQREFKYLNYKERKWIASIVKTMLFRGAKIMWESFINNNDLPSRIENKNFPNTAILEYKTYFERIITNQENEKIAI